MNSLFSQWNLTQGGTADLIMVGIVAAFVFALVGMIYDNS